WLCSCQGCITSWTSSTYSKQSLNYLYRTANFGLLGKRSAATAINYGLKRWRRLIGYSRCFPSVSAVTRLPVTSILRFPKQTSQPTVSKEKGARRLRG